MKLYKIIFTHYSPKDSQEGICTYVIANDDEQVMRLVDEKYCWGAWKEKQQIMDEEGEMLDIYDNHYNTIGQETFLQRVLRYKGECNDPDLEPQDLFYGATYYGWEETDSDITELSASVLLDLGITEDWRHL